MHDLAKLSVYAGPTLECTPSLIECAHLFVSKIFHHIVILFEVPCLCFKSAFTFLAGTPTGTHVPSKKPESDLSVAIVVGCLSSLILILAAFYTVWIRKKKKRFAKYKIFWLFSLL